MNREIKFRAWDKKLKQWASIGFHVFGETTLFNLLQQYCFETSGESSSLDRLLNDLEVTQYTGLKDKNTKERCEGDIIKRNTGYVFEEKIYSFSLGYGDKSSAFGYNYHPEDEIIGNIYETPHLLNSEQSVKESDDNDKWHPQDYSGKNATRE